jgi:protein-tyrosine phosphatase
MGQAGGKDVERVERQGSEGSEGSGGGVSGVRKSLSRSLSSLRDLGTRSPQLAKVRARRSSDVGVGQEATAILKGRLYVGSRTDGMVAKLSNPRHFTHVLCLEESTKYPEEGCKIKFLHVDLDDGGQDRLDDFVPQVGGFIDEGVRTGKVLVHCTSGVNRSPTIVMWYLMTYHGFSFEAARLAVSSRRDGFNVHKSYLKQLEEMVRREPHSPGSMSMQTPIPVA